MDTQTDEQGRPQPPENADELATLLGFLDFQRATLTWKTDGLDAEGFAATVGASSMTLGGILTHLAWVEDSWFTWRLSRRDPGSPQRFSPASTTHWPGAQPNVPRCSPRSSTRRRPAPTATPGSLPGH